MWLAEKLGLAASTVRTWLREWREARRLAAKKRGRPRGELSPLERRAVLELFRDHPSLGARRVARMAGLPRRAVADLKARVMGMLARWRRRSRCEWTRPGAVWAMDFTEPKVPMEHGATRVLVVRDLASGRQLAAIALRGESSRDVVRELRALFHEHGPPLVLKCDNGGPLVAKRVRRLLRQHGVALLRSPPYCPAYNGSCERSLGWTKVGAVECMHARGAEELGQADLDQARHLQNATGSPRHLRGQSPEEAWSGRTPIPPEERVAFQEALAAALEREEQDFEKRTGHSPDRRDCATIQRAATSRVLCELDYLRIRRR